jgi:hypothetical protein
MPNDRDDEIAISVDGGFPLYRYRDLFTAIDYAYNYVYVGLRLLEASSLHGGHFESFYAEENKRFGRHVPMHDRLILSAAEFHSPGYFSLKGSGEILKQIRLYIQDRHKRRQDREIREPAERRRLELQNQLMETELLGQRLQIARENGLSAEETQQIVRRMFVNPLTRLDPFQNQGVLLGDSEVASDRLLPGNAHSSSPDGRPIRRIHLPDENEE